MVAQQHGHGMVQQHDGGPAAYLDVLLCLRGLCDKPPLHPQGGPGRQACSMCDTEGVPAKLRQAADRGCQGRIASLIFHVW